MYCVSTVEARSYQTKTILNLVPSAGRKLKAEMRDQWGVIGLLIILGVAVCTSPVDLIDELTPLITALQVRGFILFSGNTTVMSLLEKRTLFLNAKQTMMIRDDCTLDNLSFSSCTILIALKTSIVTEKVFFKRRVSTFVNI
jgi:hypothetical protein